MGKDTGEKTHVIYGLKSFHLSLPMKNKGLYLSLH